MREYLNNIAKQMKPKYDETTAYLTALACAVLFFVHPEFRKIYVEILSGAGAANKASLAFIALGLIATIGFFLSFFHVFFYGEKSPFEKICIGTFIIGANGFAGIMAGVEMLSSRWSIAMIIPVWNIFMGVLLLYQLGLNKFDISDRNSSIFEVLVASITLIIVFVITDYGFHLSWAMALSVCVFYSSTIFFVVMWLLNLVRLRFFVKAK
jgi:hypothetical protein